jgi:hypothetical protein
MQKKIKPQKNSKILPKLMVFYQTKTKGKNMISDNPTLMVKVVLICMINQVECPMMELLECPVIWEE